MLKGIHPLLTADLLHVLASMGHGDEIAVVDANFPSVTVGKRIVHVPGADSPAVLGALLTVFPVDAIAKPAAFTMQVVGDPAAVPEAVAALHAALGLGGVDPSARGALERQAFYARARAAFAVVRAGEMRPYGNVLLVKGVVNAYPAA
ncbi:MAG: ribose ABC transporter [Burkholderiales bacterium]|nr:ribose ABC transporter [Burkholderiales bacterium]